MQQRANTGKTQPIGVQLASIEMTATISSMMDAQYYRYKKRAVLLPISLGKITGGLTTTMSSIVVDELVIQRRPALPSPI